jgi:predicted membrane channel-forming protein YqfA (hemolysin III family)
MGGVSPIASPLAMVACCGTVTVNGAYRRFNMINLNRLGIGGLIFLIGAAIYVINLALALGKKRTTIPIDGVGLMVLGLGMALLLRW